MLNLEKDENLFGFIGTRTTTIDLCNLSSSFLSGNSDYYEFY